MQRLRPFLDVSHLRSLLPTQAVTRFAPSPTGYLHLGHIAHALYVWGVAAAVGAKIILRLENHDRQRCQAAYEEALIRDLEWLGLLGPQSPACLSPAFERQSDHPHYYSQALLTLAQQQLTYACQCSRKDLQSMAGQRPTGGELFYPGSCRQLALDPRTAGLSLRFKLSADRLESFCELGQGVQTQNPSQQCGDFILRDRHGQFSYHLSVVVDDLRHGVNLVIRGVDLFAASGRQEALRRALGAKSPLLYLHHPLLYEASGHQKLSKRWRSTSIMSHREAGETPGRILGLAAAQLGLLPSGRCIAPQDFAELLAASQQKRL